MINLTPELIFRMRGLALLKAANECLAQIPTLMSGVILSKDMTRDYKTFEQVFCLGMTGVTNVEDALQVWLEIAMSHRTGRALRVSTLLPGVDNFRTQITYAEFKPFAKLFFILMYKHGALLLPYRFEKPSPSWLSQVEANHGIWSELVASFRALGEVSRTMQNRGHVRLLQTSSKILMTTDWYSADLIQESELNEMHIAYGKGLGGMQTPIPFVGIMNHTLSVFPNSTPKEIGTWVEIYQEPVRNRAGERRAKPSVSQAAKQDLHHILTYEENWVEKLRDFINNNSLAGIHFSDASFRGLGLGETLLRAYGVDTSAAVESWTRSQEWMLSYKSLEQDRQYRTSFGRLNLWLFIYLPAWLTKFPGVAYPYPETPNKFLPIHHVDKRDPRDRPMCLTEFYEYMGWVVNRTNMSRYQLFFAEVENSDLPGCELLRQPITVLPAEKAKGEVVKNILDPEDDKYFMALLESLEGLSQALFDCRNLYSLVEAAKDDQEFLDFEKVGFVPFIYVNSKSVPIRYLPPQVFHFTTYKGRRFYNPGMFRFCLFLRWAGPRGQNAQWLDANLYGLSAMRISDNPNGVDLLYMNTDKIRTYPYTVTVFNKNIWLLDRQNAWRAEMLDVHGVDTFGKRVRYERRAKTKWGNILPLFASDGATGEPFSDTQYFRTWTMLFLGLQSSLRQQRIGKAPLVSWLPVLKNKKVADWDAWTEGRVASSDIAIFDRETMQQRVISGPYCRVNLRCYSTPHGGGRTAFVSDVSNYLSPELGANLTGQTPAQFTKYNKGRALFSEIEGAFNTKEPEVLTQLSSDMPTMYKLAEDFETRRRSGASVNDLAAAGFFNGTHQGFQLNIDSLLSEQGLAYSVCATHICLLKFKCSTRVVSEIGHGNCPECPYAIFSVKNMMAVAATVRRSYDEYISIERRIASHSEKFSDFERERLSEKLKEVARSVVSWRKIEMSLWAIIKLNQHNEYGGFLVGGEDEFVNAVQQYKVSANSKEDFLENIIYATAFKELVSEDMNLKMDRAARILMAGQGKIREALSMPVSWSAAEMLASEIKVCMERYDINFDRLSSLLTLSEGEWRDLMITHAPSAAEDQVEGFGLIARIRNT